MIATVFSLRPGLGESYPVMAEFFDFHHFERYIRPIVIEFLGEESRKGGSAAQARAQE
jgi:hypothetical protein